MKSKIQLALCVLFGALMIFSGLNKFFEFAPMPTDLPEEMAKDMAAYIEISWLLPLAGFFEIVGGILLIIPKTRALGAIILTPIMVGIALNSFVVDSSGIIFTVVLLAILGWIIYDHRSKYMPMIS